MSTSGEPGSLKVAPIWLRSGAGARGVDSAWVRQLAKECGLEVAAIAGPEPFDGLESHLHDRIAQGHYAGFSWFTPERASVSADPHQLHAQVKSIVSVGLPYYQVMPEIPDDGLLRGKISRYAWGLDYHDFLKQRMSTLLERIEAKAGRPVEARRLVDTARIVDRAVAGRSGLGWYGKHTCIIVPGYGSWVLLGELLLDFELEPDAPLDRNCGRCRACIDRCPTGAITGPYELDSTRCISFQTIEQRDAIPVELRTRFGNWVFGCDECQEICPYTGAAQVVADPDLQPASLRNVAPELDWLLAMTESDFRATYRGTAVLRAKRRGLARNAAVALGNAGDDRAVPVLSAALFGHDEPLVRGHAAWALGRYPGRSARDALDCSRGTESDPDAKREINLALERIAG
ncbi:MAG: tRNA epoxyqueuosine(34) reductase QueG [Thermomicrobiales bacterium]